VLIKYLKLCNLGLAIQKPKTEKLKITNAKEIEDIFNVSDFCDFLKNGK
jgi:hypothetical protein